MQTPGYRRSRPSRIRPSTEASPTWPAGPEDLGSVYSVRISSATELENLESNVSQGDVVRVEQPETPYRISSWIDLNTDDVTVAFESAYAANGGRIVKISDGANVGGIRVGSSSATKNVTVRGYGHDGNPNNQDGSAKRLHGVLVEDADNVVIEGCDIYRTSPYSEHGSGGSGITVRHGAGDVWIAENYIEDIGDRGIQVAGDNILIRGNIGLDGFDRTISFNVNEPDGNSYIARNVACIANYGRDNSDGSIIGSAGGSQNTDRGYFAIIGNVGEGAMRRLITLRTDERATVIAGNVGVNGGGDAAPGINVGQSSPDFAHVIANNVLRGYERQGILANTTNVTVNGNIIEDCGEASIENTGVGCTIQSNIVSGCGGIGIDSQAGESATVRNIVRDNDK